MGEDQILEMEEKNLELGKSSQQAGPGLAKLSESVDIKRALIDESMNDISTLMKQVSVPAPFYCG